MRELIHRIVHPTGGPSSIFTEAKGQEARFDAEAKERDDLRVAHREALADAKRAFHRYVELTEQDIEERGAK